MDESNGTAEIPLTNGMIALIDAEDFEKVSQYKWYFHHKAGRRGFNVGYIETTKRINGRKLPLHRLILEPKADECIDHINRNTLDNRKSNLRLCTVHQNCFNRGPNPGHKFKGSILRKRKRGPDIYESQICFNWKIIFLGTFRTAEEAARAYDKKAKELFGEFACLNFPEEDAI